jgi:malate/lactate dehydrogenase
MTELDRKPARIAVIGGGRVGSTFAYTAPLRELAAEILLIDQDRAKAEGEDIALDPVDRPRVVVVEFIWKMIYVVPELCIIFTEG